MGGNLSGAKSITASVAITGGSLTDGTATLSSGALSDAVSITATGAITGGSLTDGTATLSGGDFNTSTIVVESTTDSSSKADGALIVNGGVSIHKHLTLGQGTTGVLGDIISVALFENGPRSKNPTVVAGDPLTAAPLGTDIINYFVDNSLDFASGQYTVSLVENVVNGSTSAAVGTFLYIKPSITLVHTLETASTDLSLEVDSVDQTVTLLNNLTNDAVYQVRILTIADSDSARSGY